MTRSSIFRTLGASLVLALTLPLAADEQRSKAPGPSAAARVDLNTASLKALEANAAIGPDAARAIIAARPFKTINDLDRIPGISAERLEQIRAQSYVSAPPPRTPLGEPTTEKQPLGSPAPAATVAPTGRVNINTASFDALAAIPVIGPDVARQLVAARPFRSLDELSRLKGLNAEQLEQIKSVLTLDAAPIPAKSKP